MKLSEYLRPEQVILLLAKKKVEALSELAGVLSAVAEGVSREALTSAIFKREELMSTGMGNGLAVPHVRMAGLKRAAMAVGVRRDGIADYQSLDGEPIRVVVMIAAPQGQHDTYIRLLAGVADVLRNEQMSRTILLADDTEEIYRILTEKRP